MEKKQKINCTVESCKYNDGRKQMCELDAIEVAPKNNVSSGKADESECASYKCCQ